jgi:hypothetical protein
MTPLLVARLKSNCIKDLSASLLPQNRLQFSIKASGADMGPLS